MEDTELHRGTGALRSDESGGAILLTLLVAVVVLGLASVVMILSGSEVRVSSNYQRGLAAKYVAEAGLDHAVGSHNDLTATPRYLFDEDNYASRASGPDDTTFFDPMDAVAPLSDGDAVVGTIERRILGKDPVVDAPPYRVESTARMEDGTSTTYQALVDVLSLLDFALFSDEDVYIAPDIVLSGRVYSAKKISLTGPTSTFLRRVEYGESLENESYGDFQMGHEKIDERPSISDIVDLDFFEDAARNAGVCGDGRGLYIGTGGSVASAAQTTALFRAYQDGDPAEAEAEDAPGCRENDPCYAIDLTLFDFSASPITYNGVPLVGDDGGPLTDFNGVIWVDQEVHVWGHLGGRSPEDGTVADQLGYMTPPGIDENLYSNDLLDNGEDGSNGGTANGLLDPAGQGMNLGIYTEEYLYIDHNIWAGTDANGDPVRLGLVAKKDVRIDSYSPRTIIVEAAVLSVDESWRPQGSVQWKWQGGWTLENDTHQENDWARNGGDGGPNTYRYDLDGDGQQEGNNGIGQSGDRNENSMRDAWTLRNVGNLVVNERPHSGPWSQPSWDPHPRYYTYDTNLMTAEIPCYPTLSTYGITPGSFREIGPQP